MNTPTQDNAPSAPSTQPQPQEDRIPRTMVIATSFLLVAAIFIIFAGIKAAQAIIGPFCLAAFLAVILTAPLRWLKSKGFSDMGASLVICAGVLFCGMSIIWILSASVNQFVARIPEYTAKCQQMLTEIDDFLEPYGLSLQGGPKEPKYPRTTPIMRLFHDVAPEAKDDADPSPDAEAPRKPEKAATAGTSPEKMPPPQPPDKPETETAEAPVEAEQPTLPPPDPESDVATAKEPASPFSFLHDPFAQQEAEAINTVGIVGYIQRGGRELGKLGATCFIVMILVVFMMFETSRMPKKILRAFGGGGVTNDHLQQIVDKIWKYMYIKSIISFFVGSLVWLLLVANGVQYASLWALLAFFLNFIPNIGSIIAAVPGIALALFDHGLGTCVIVTIGYLVINQGLGYYVEPIYLGDGLGLSPLVVLLSLIFWGWLLGLIGMFLSAPLTIVAKIILDSFEDTRWVAILMEDK